MIDIEGVYATNLGGKTVDPTAILPELQAEGIPAAGAAISGDQMWLTDEAGEYIPPSPEIDAVVAAHIPPPRVTEYAGSQRVNAMARTTDDVPLEVFRFPCEQRRLYVASLSISGIDAGNFAIKQMEGRFVWKRGMANAIITGITVVSDIHDIAAASWLPNALAQDTDVVFTVKGASGRTIDWLLTGDVGVYAPGGLQS